MYCPNCGTEVDENDSFCKECGNVLKKKDNIQDTEPKDSFELNKRFEKIEKDPTFYENENTDFFHSPTKMTILAGALIFNLPSVLVGIVAGVVHTESLTSLEHRVGTFGTLFYILGLALLISVRVRYPAHRASKNLLIVTIVLGVITILVTVILFVTCFNMLNEAKCS